MPDEIKNIKTSTGQCGAISIPDFREKIIALQNGMIALIEDQKMVPVDCPVNHHFSGDSYAREIFIPAGTLIIGKIHRHAHVNVISQGECIVYTETGQNIFKAPLTFVSEPETKRAVLAVTDVIWTTIHVTSETDLDKIEQYVISPTYNDLNVGLIIGGES